MSAWGLPLWWRLRTSLKRFFGSLRAAKNDPVLGVGRPFVSSRFVFTTNARIVVGHCDTFPSSAPERAIKSSIPVYFGVRMRTFLTLAFLVSGLCRSPAAEDGAPASSNLGNAEYPRIGSDQRVTFRLKAPNAQQVKLE